MVDKVDRGKLLFSRQTLPQVEPIAADRTAVIVMIRFEIESIDVTG